MQKRVSERATARVPVAFLFYIGCRPWWSAPGIKGDSFYIDIILPPHRHQHPPPPPLHVQYVYNIILLKRFPGFSPLFDQKGSHTFSCTRPSFSLSHQCDRGICWFLTIYLCGRRPLGSSAVAYCAFLYLSIILLGTSNIILILDERKFNTLGVVKKSPAPTPNGPLHSARCTLKTETPSIHRTSPLSHNIYTRRAYSTCIDCSALLTTHLTYNRQWKS